MKLDAPTRLWASSALQTENDLALTFSFKRLDSSGAHDYCGCLSMLGLILNRHVRAWLNV